MKIRTSATIAAAALTIATAGCGSAGSSTKTTAGNATDKAFVDEMIPHHRSAVQMARIAQARGQHPQVKRLAAKIIKSQDQEIALMTSIRGRLDPTSSGQSMSMGGSSGMGMSKAQMGMNMHPAMLRTANPFDRAFLTMMVPHHAGAIRMARVELAHGKNGQLRSLAQRIIAAQDKEIAEMTSWKRSWYHAGASMGG